MQWHREITRLQWRTLIAAQLGWMLDAMDVMLYSFALTAVRTEFHLTSAAAGALAAAPLVTSAIGGMLFGWLSDRYGRARALVWSILTFSVLTAFTATLTFIAATKLGPGRGALRSRSSIILPHSGTVLPRQRTQDAVCSPKFHGI
jgi:MFS family permease